MVLSEAQAFWILGMLPRENVPAIAQDALEAGLDDPSLRVLAGLTKYELDEVGPLFEKALVAQGLRKPDKLSALRICIRAISLQIVESDISPYDGARLIWRATQEAGGLDEAGAFIYAASEYEDRPEDRPFFANAILEEARRWCDATPSPVPGPQ